MFLKLVRVVLRRRERETRRNDSLDRWVVGEVQEQRYTVQTTVLFEVLFEESCCLHVDTHGSKDDREVVLVPVMDVLGWPFNQAGLPHDLGSNL